MILSSKIKITNQNTNKTDQLEILHVEYVRVLGLLIDSYWDYYNLDRYDYKKHGLRKWSYYPPILTLELDSILSARMTKCAKTQAIGMIKAVTSKLNKLFYVLKLEQNKQVPDKDKIASLQKRIQKNRNLTKPYISNKTPMELNTIVFKKVDNKTKSFDSVYQLYSVWSKDYKKKNNLTNKINLVVKSHRHNNKLAGLGKEMTSFLVTPSGFNVRYDIKTPKVKSGIVGAIDQGISYCITMVDETGKIQQSVPCDHKHTLKSILSKMKRKKKGSNNFSDCQDHRTNYVNWAINQLDLTGIKEIRLESLRDISRGRNVGRFLTSFPYVEIRTKLQKVCALSGVRLVEQSNMYRSQRCSSCGFVRKDNRKGDVFCCKGCGHTEQSDVNAAKNHLANIPEINSHYPLSRTTGFYWI